MELFNVKRTQASWRLYRAVLWSCLALFLAAPWARAAIRHSYGLDSLVYMASEIFEGDLVRSYKENTLDLVEIRISAVHRGTFKAGESVTMTAMDFYKTTSTLTRQYVVNLSPGDHLVIFAVRAKSNILWEIPEGAKIYGPVPSGLKLVEDHHVFSFFQHINPGPYESDIRPRWSDDEFEKKLAAAIKEVEPLRPHLDKRAGKEDLPWLVKFVRERAAKRGVKGREFEAWGNRDALWRTACARVAESDDLAAMLEVAGVGGFSEGVDPLATKLANPAGRNLLLSKIEDEKEPMEDRIRYAKFLGYITSYAWFFATGVGRDGAPEPSVRADGTGGYLPRLAKLASATASQGPLCEALLRCLYSPLHDYVSMPPGPTPADKEVRETLEVIRGLRDVVEEEGKRSPPPSADRQYHLAGVREGCDKILHLFPRKTE